MLFLFALSQRYIYILKFEQSFMSRAIEIACNRLVWRHIQKERAFVQMLEKDFPIPEGLSEEDRKMMLDPLGYAPIIDIDEIHSRNRRKTDDPYIKATSDKIAHRFPKIDDAERR